MEHRPLNSNHETKTIAPHRPALRAAASVFLTPSRALTVYATNAEIAAALAGFGTADIIEISGQTIRLDGVLTLITGSVSGFAVSGRTSTAPMLANALTVAPSDIAEPYESNLVCLKNVSFTAVGDSFLVGNDYALADSAAMVYIATDDLGLGGQSVPDGLHDITGIVIPNPAGDGYRLAPRGPGDIVSVPEPGVPGILCMGIAASLALQRRVIKGGASHAMPKVR